jgi:hypothetical protein
MIKVHYSVLCSAALVVLVLVCASSEECHQSQIDHNIMSKQHYKKVNDFRCKEPQQRLFQLKELDIAIKSGVLYYPSATVLRRCDCATGYCNNKEFACSANVTEQVKLVFRLKQIVEGEILECEYIEVSVTEHISCSCQPIGNKTNETYASCTTY